MIFINQNTEIILDMLTSTSVSVLKRNYFDLDGVRYYGNNERNAYVNDEEGRLALKATLPANYYNMVISFWNLFEPVE